MTRGKEERELLLLLMSLFFEFNENHAKGRKDSSHHLNLLIMRWRIVTQYVVSPTRHFDHSLCFRPSANIKERYLSSLSISMASAYEPVVARKRRRAAAPNIGLSLALVPRPS